MSDVELQMNLYGSEEEHPDEELRSLAEGNCGVDLFLENCSSLYNLILDALHNLTAKTVSCEYLEAMASELEINAKEIVAMRPDVENTIILRLNTICSAMEQLRLRNAKISTSSSDSDTGPSRSHVSSVMRGWLHSMERKLAEHDVRLRKGANLAKLLADQQVVQLEIQTEGQQLINRLFRPSCVEEEKRAATTLQAIRKRWYTTYLNSLSLQFRIEDRLNKLQEAYESESDAELAGPPPKRARRRSRSPEATSSVDVDDDGDVEEEEDDDVLPFGESEYESIMDGRTTVTSCSSADERSPTTAKKWDSVQQDIGYSSGENSIHEAMHQIVDQIPETEPMRRRRIECSPVKAFYRTVQLDEMSDVEVNKAVDESAAEEEQQLSESMYVNHDSHNNTLTFTEYDEVMAMFDDEAELPTDGLNDSFHTKWRSIAGRQLKKPQRLSREQVEHMAKNSCDASSEDSSECELEAANPSENSMNCSFNSACFDTSSPLKRQRSGRALRSSNFMLESLEMDASFCSTRSEMPPCKSRTAMRKKLRVRRMPRSMSDGEQLGVCPGAMTPTIRVSPPTTPLARSTTRLLQKLDDDLRRRGDSDTAPEHSDAQVYEWDEYNPPAKDDSIGDDATTTTTMAIPRVAADVLLSVDDDFNAHFGTQSTMRLVEESRSHLDVVHRSLEAGDLNVKQLANIELIVRNNLRQLDAALKFQPQHSLFEASVLKDLRAQWAVLFDQMVNPVPQILNKVERFANSLRVLHDSSTSSALNGVTEIRTKEDLKSALDGVRQIESRLSNERDELRELVSSEMFKDALKELSMEFGAISDEYEEAVSRIRGVASNLDNINAKWDMWCDRQADLRKAMAGMERCMRDGSVDQNAMIVELELCQERMDSLETVCNYLTSTLMSLQNDASGRHVPDFHAEFSVYANALAQLRARFNDVLRVPSPPTPKAFCDDDDDFIGVPQEPTTTTQRRRGRVAQTQTQADVVIATKTPPRLLRRVADAVSSSRMIQAMLALSVLSALAALFYVTIFGRSFGPHVTYVNGPPPV